MNPEDLSFATWQAEQFELEGVREAMHQADCGRLVLHSTVEHLFEHDRTCEAVRTSWADAVIHKLRSTCEYFAQCTGGDKLKETFLGQMFSTVEFICKHPNIGRSGRVRGTREWNSGLGCPKIVYREISGEIQFLGVLVLDRKWPHMQTGSV